MVCWAGVDGHWKHSCPLPSGQLPLASQACVIAMCKQECWLLDASKDQTAVIHFCLSLWIVCVDPMTMTA